MNYYCFHEFSSLPPAFPGPPVTRRPAYGCARHQEDLLRPADPWPPRALWPSVASGFILVMSIPDDSQNSHDWAHARLHDRAAAINPRFYCQTCGLFVGRIVGLRPSTH